MIEWTNSAQRVWSEYTSQTKSSLTGTGADPQEVLEDLKRHVDEEISASKLSVVTEEDLRKILAKIGSPELVSPAIDQPASADEPPQPEPEKPPKPPGFMLFILGILLPAITLGFEYSTGISAGVLFDPIPSWIHILLVALVPASNLWLGGPRDANTQAAKPGWAG